MDIIKEKAKELIPYFKHQNFQEIFDEMTSGESNNTQFLLRMEIKRLRTPSVRILDYRNDGDAQEYEYKGVKHYLLPDDITEFESLLELYGGVYTTGLQEELSKHHAERKKSKREEAVLNISGQGNNWSVRYSIDAIRFANFAHRRDERMFYCSPIAISFSNGDMIFAKTSDLSCSGIKILLPDVNNIPEKQIISITFVGLIELYPRANEILSMVPYEIIGTEKRDERAWLKTKCLSNNKEFERFVLTFQESNRYRYRIDIDYFAYILNNKALQFQYLPKVSGIPLIFSNDFEPKLMYALKSNFNHDDLDYWRDERSDDKLGSLFTSSRINSILGKPENKHFTYIYSFKHTLQNHTYFISATIEELRQLDLVETFFKMSKGKDSFRVFKFDLKQIKFDEKYIRDLIPHVKGPEAEDIQKIIEKMGYIGQLTRIDTDYDHQIYEQYTSDIPANSLQQFTNNTDEITHTKLEYLQYITPRKEQRYVYQTAATLSSEYVQVTQGWTRDISTNGLQLELSNAVRCFNGDVVFVSLPKFQELKKSIPLTNIPYEVIYVNSAHTILHLKLRKTLVSNQISAFLEELIKNNLKVLKPAQNSPHMSSMSKALRNLTIANLFSTPLFLMKGKHNRLGYLCETTTTAPNNKIMRVFKSEKGQLNVYPLFSNNVLKKVLDQLPTLKVVGGNKQINILVCRTVKTDGSIDYVPKIENDFKNINDRVTFISNGLKQGFFGAYSIFISASTTPDITELKTDLEYLKRCAAHKYSAVENAIWNIIGIVDIIDITDSVFAKYNFDIKKEQKIEDENLEIK